MKQCSTTGLILSSDVLLKGDELLLPETMAAAESAAATDRDRELWLLELAETMPLGLTRVPVGRGTDVAAIRIRHALHSVCEQGRSLGVCSPSS